MNIYEKLMNIQSELKAPKSQFNSFGNYNYRSCEDILEGLKPIILKHKAAVVVTDEIMQIGGRYYVKAIAKLIDIESGESIEASAYAREEESKKGMDLSQITGSTSSYARKYALNGLFAIDDTKDSDFTNKHEDKPKNEGKKTSSNSSDSSTFTCSSCNATITQAVHTFSTNKFKKPLCRDCQGKEK